MLEALGYESEPASDGFEALRKFKSGVDLVLMDIMMPQMDGFETVRRIKADEDGRDIPIVMVTGLGSKEDRLRAVEAGADDFISKPVDKVELKVRVESQLKMKQARDALKRHKEELEITVEKRTAELRKSLEDMAKEQQKTQRAYLDTIHRLVMASEFKDNETGAHIQRVSEFSALIACALGLSPSEVEIVLEATPMHDVGKIGIPDAILRKEGELSPEEWEIMKLHTIIGSSILRGSASEVIRAGEIIALSHHENWDGAGYPKGLAGEEIPLWGRICAVADTYDALTTARPYRKAISGDEALDILREGRGRQFDPRIVDLFIEHSDEALAINEAYGDSPGLYHCLEMEEILQRGLT
jgi:putative two-component system response regulator